MANRKKSYEIVFTNHLNPDGNRKKSYEIVFTNRRVRYFVIRFFVKTARGGIFLRKNLHRIEKKCKFAVHIVPRPDMGLVLSKTALLKERGGVMKNEWRIIAPTPASKALQKLTGKGIKQFVELPIPIDCITAIFFGPKATAVNKQVINCVCQLFHQIKGYKYPIKLSKSGIHIR